MGRGYRRDARVPPCRPDTASTGFLSSHLKVLGQSPGLFASEAPGASLVLPAGKPYAVLCLLALHEEAVTRDDLVAYLWPHAVLERARGSVRQALHVIRRALGQDVLDENGGQLVLKPGYLSVDLARLRDSLESGDLEGCHAMWEGGPFSSFSLADASPFNVWADQIRGRYENQVAVALIARAVAARRSGDPEGALRWLDRALDVRPYDEEAHVTRVETLLDLHRLDDAEDAFARASSVVDDLSGDVADGLRDRLGRLRRLRLLETESTESHPPLQFVGRTAEIAELRLHWRSVLSARPRSVAILGGAGIGKTRLAEEFVRYSLGPDGAVVRAKALDTERGLDYGLVVALVKDLVGRPGGAGITNASLELFRQLIPSLGNGSEVQHVGVSEVGLADALSDLVEAVGHETPLVIFVDDLQWADPRSRTVLLRTARSVRHVPVLFLHTCRSGDADTSVMRPLRSEESSGRLSTIELAPLSRPEIRESIEYTLRVEPEEAEEEVTTRLVETSRGNPLFLSELLRKMQEDGVVERVDGEWVCYADRMEKEVRLPSSIRELLEERLAALDDVERAVVATLAHHGTPQPSSGLARKAGVTEDRATQAWLKLVDAGIIARTRDDELALAHDALAEVARQVLVAPNRRRRRRLTQYVAAAAILLVVAALTRGIWMPATAASTPSHLMGGGVIYAMVPGAVVRMHVPAHGHATWTSSTVAHLNGVKGQTTVWQGPGQTAPLVISTHLTPAGRAAAVEVSPDGSYHPLLRHDGDVNITDLSPDGRYALLSIADESATSWSLHLVHFSLADGGIRRIRRLGLGTARWLPDASGLAAIVRAETDTVLVLRPDGTTLWSALLPRGGALGSICPFGRDEVLLPRALPGRLPILTVIRSSGVREDVTPKAPLRGGVVCSPHGHRVGYVGLVDGTSRLVLQDLTSGDTLVGPPVANVIGWALDHPSPVPVGVRVDKDTTRLRWGEGRRLEASVRFSDGTVRRDTLVHWTSLDPHVAYASPDGRIFGNGGGRTAVVASVYGWMSDTTEVDVVADRTPPGALLADRFGTFDTTRWVAFGAPRPAAVTLPDGPALDLRGDGVGSDGMISRAGFDLGKGATLELEFRLPLTRRDRQSIQVGLAAIRQSDGGRADNLTEGLRYATDAVGFEHPVGELAVFDSTTFGFGGPVAPGRISRPDLFPSREWRHLAIVLAPDGRARLFVDRQQVAELPLPVTMRLSDRWHVYFVGRAADTHLMIRNLVLWEGMRY